METSGARAWLFFVTVQDWILDRVLGVAMNNELPSRLQRRKNTFILTAGGVASPSGGGRI